MLLKKIDVAELKDFVARRGLVRDVLRDVAGIPDEILDSPRREHPCPKCGGSTRCRLVDVDAGAVFCSHCGRNNGDFIATVRWALDDCDFAVALDAIAERVGFRSNEISAPPTPNRAASPEAETVYSYFDAENVERWRVRRLDFADGRKTFRQERFENGGWVASLAVDPESGKKIVPVPYRLPEIRSFGVAEIYVVEGEECADSLNDLFRSVGAPRVATTLAGGSNSAPNWAFAARYLPGALPVVVLADADEPGRKAAAKTFEILRREGRDVSVVEFAPPPTFRGKGFDVADWLADRRAEGLSAAEIFDAFERVVRPPEAAPEPRIAATVRALDEYEDRDFEWVWPGYIPSAGISLIGGEPGVGKSTFLAWFAATLSTGRPFPNEPTVEREPASVLLFRGEDDVSRVVKKKASQFEADLSKIVVFEEFVESGKLVPPSLRRLDALSAAIDATERKTGAPCRAIVVDPVSIAWGDGVDANKQADVRAVLRPLQIFVEERNLAAILVRRLRKSSSADKSSLKDRFYGSIDTLAAARVAYNLRALKTRPGYSEMRCAKSNCFDYRSVAALRWTLDDWGRLCVEFDDGANDGETNASPKRNEREERRGAALDWVLRYFREYGEDVAGRGRAVRRGQFKASDEAVGIFGAAANEGLFTVSEIRRALQELNVEAWNRGRDYFYSLPQN